MPYSHVPSLPGLRRDANVFWMSVPDFLDADECDQLISWGDAQGMNAAGLTGGRMATGIRSARSCWLDEDTMPWLSVKLIRALSDLQQKAFPFELTGFEEGFQLLRYDGVGDADFYDWHIDIGRSGANASRKLSLVIQLSDPTDYEGGELLLNPDGHQTEETRCRGCLTAFPSYVLHRVNPVTAGVRYSFAAWAHGPAFR